LRNRLFDYARSPCLPQVSPRRETPLGRRCIRSDQTLVSMDFDRNSFLFCFVIVLSFSYCSSVRKSASNSEAVVLLASVLESDTCSLIIDGRKYLDQRVICTDRSLSIDLNTLVKFDVNRTDLRKLEVFRPCWCSSPTSQPKPLPSL